MAQWASCKGPVPFLTHGNPGVKDPAPGHLSHPQGPCAGEPAVGRIVGSPFHLTTPAPPKPPRCQEAGSIAIQSKKR